MEQKKLEYLNFNPSIAQKILIISFAVILTFIVIGGIVVFVIG